MQTGSSALTSLLTPQPYRHDPAHLAFCNARQGANCALLDWLGTGPDPDLVAEEVRGHVNAVRDLAQLHGILLR
jgi:hypothetical protein